MFFCVFYLSQYLLQYLYLKGWDAMQNVVVFSFWRASTSLGVASCISHTFTNPYKQMRTDSHGCVNHQAAYHSVQQGKSLYTFTCSITLL